MEYGAHLPLIQLDDTPYSLERLVDYTTAARDLGYAYLCANDHFLFSRPWLDGPAALAAVLHASGDMRLATTVALPVVRGPVSLAKTLTAIDILSGGRLVVGVGPGSSAHDYEAVGVPFEERWARLDESIRALRALWAGSRSDGEHFYAVSDIELTPRSPQQPGPPIWIGSWGSEAGMRRVARLGDGWIASGYNTTPEVFARSRAYLGDRLARLGKQAEGFPNALATMWMYVTEDRQQEERVLTEVLQPMLNRPLEDLRQRVLVGPAERCAQLLAAYADAGLQRVFVWPLADETDQLRRFREQVVPLVRPA